MTGTFPDPETAALMDAAAIPVAVLLAQVRYPDCEVTAQAHSNPGFDLFVARDGAVVRFVELKATSRKDGVFFMSEYQRRFSEDNASRYSLLLLSDFDLSTRRCSPHWFDGAIADHADLRPARYQGVPRL